MAQQAKEDKPTVFVVAPIEVSDGNHSPTPNGWPLERLLLVEARKRPDYFGSENRKYVPPHICTRRAHCVRAKTATPLDLKTIKENQMGTDPSRQGSVLGLLARITGPEMRAGDAVRINDCEMSNAAIIVRFCSAWTRVTAEPDPVTHDSGDEGQSLEFDGRASTASSVST